MNEDDKDVSELESQSSDASTESVCEHDSDEQVVASKASAASDGSESANKHTKAKHKKRFMWTRARITVTVIVVVVVVCGAGAWVWHGTPGFCGTLCHASMANYSQTYTYSEGETGYDKWGNEVSDAEAMLVVRHKDEDGTVCLDCHVPSTSQQLSEVQETITSDYYYPLDEVGTKALMENADRGNQGDSFCINDSCHSDLTRDALTEKTADLSFNPHDWEAHGEIPCSNCHKSHRASTLYCTQCHNEAEEILPDGWVTDAEGAALEKDAMDS